MCQQAPQAVVNLERIGVAFSRFENGKIYQRAYGGQKTNFGKGGLAYRACCAKDRTGHAILNSLYQQCLKNGVKFFNEFFVTDLLIENKSQCHGAVAIDLNEGTTNIFNAQHTIIATGGYSQIYKNATSSSICTGDGNAMLLRCALQLQDMEFVQFHPTSLYGSNLLITEAARGEGGYLVNSQGERFMERYSPEFKDLASRDVIARAMATEIHEGRGCGDKKDHLHLVLSHLGAQTIKEKLPAVCELAESFAKIDATTQPIPVTPVAHYTMGGIPANINCQVTHFDGKQEKVVDGLMAIGEAACMSVHGANRLGCNSLLDIVVFGQRCAEFIAEIAKTTPNCPQNLIDEKLSRINKVLEQQGDSTMDEIKLQLQEISWKFAGIFRNKTLLSEGLALLHQLYKQLKSVNIKSKTLFWNNELTEFLETENLLIQAIATMQSALLREESRGSHFREDFTKTSDNWLCHSLISFTQKDDKEELDFDFQTKKVK